MKVRTSIDIGAAPAKKSLFMLPTQKAHTPFTGSIQDLELAEALAEAYAKHGPKLAEILRNL